MSARAQTRVALVHNIIPPYRVPLFEALAADPRIDLRVFFMAQSEANRAWRVPETLRFAHEFLPGLHSEWLQGAFTLHANPSVIRALRRFDPHSVVIGGWDSLTVYLAALVASLGRRRLVLWSESNAIGRPLAEGLKAAPKRWLLRRAAAALVPGQAAEEYLRRLGGSQLQIERFPNVVDVRALALPAARRQELRRERRAQLALEGTTFAFVGQLIERKGLPELFEAFARAAFGAAATLLVVGDGPLRALAAERAAASRPGRRIALSPFLQLDALAGIYAAADALVLPSRADPWPLVPVEAMTAGLPVLASDAVGNAPDLVLPGRTGFVFRARDADALAACLAQAATADLAQLGAQAREHVAEVCSLERCVESFARATGAA